MPTAADLIKGFEGCELKAYADPDSPQGKARAKGVIDPTLDGRPWTIGYGCTGPDIGPDTVWTQEQCEFQLQHRLDAECLVLADIIIVPLTANQRAAVGSLVWNIGTAEFAHGGPGGGPSHVLGFINANQMQKAADSFLAWVHARGEVDAGLVKRRTQERAIFLTP